MIKLGDKVKIVRVCEFFSEDDEVDRYGWAHGAIAIVKIKYDDRDVHRQPYYVEFEIPHLGDRKGLWCSCVERVFEEIILPKELFEI